MHHRFMSVPIKTADMNSPEVAFQSTESVSTFDGNSAALLHALMEFYESDQVLDEGESEVELMIQLSGMVYNYLQGDE
jgi:hypothetical protein